jgi:response regulator RpfG family c-di-GMP phosphodiesterase
MSYKLLIVDDELANLRLLDRLFSKDYYCLTASSAEEAIELLNQHDVAILITDQRMPHMTGIELLKQTAKLRPHMARILLTGYTDVEALVEAINCGLVDMYLTKPWSNSDLKFKVQQALEQYENKKRRHALQVANDRLRIQLKEMKLGAAYALAEALRVRDSHGGEHAARVAEYTAAIAHRMLLNDEDREDLLIAASLHNLGHIGTPDRLLESEPLALEDRLLFQAHVERGARIMGAVPELRSAADIVRFHQENLDGTGYPRGLRGEQIPIACRIIRAAKEYDLLTHPKAAATVLSHQEAINSLCERAGKEFDPKVVEILGQTSAPAAHPDPESPADPLAPLENSFFDQPTDYLLETHPQQF